VQLKISKGNHRAQHLAWDFGTFLTTPY